MKSPRKESVVDFADIKEAKKIIEKYFVSDPSDCFGREWDAHCDVCKSCADFAVCGNVLSMKIYAAATLPTARPSVRAASSKSKNAAAPSPSPSPSTAPVFTPPPALNRENKKNPPKFIVSDDFWEKIELRLINRCTSGRPLPVGELVAFLRAKYDDVEENDINDFILYKIESGGKFYIDNEYQIVCV